MSWPVTTFYCTKCDFKRGDVRTWGAKEYVLTNGAAAGAKMPELSRFEIAEGF
ncbi:MAG: hypothetical protein HY525_09510 [Betaproteobacteria bacterium]|nr:hypothetical protein [Betaproteobacteria bacterium]